MDVYEAAKNPYQKSRDIIGSIVWNNENRPFSLEEIHDALKVAGAICRYGVCIPPKDYLKALLEHNVLKFSEALYQKSENWEENLKTIETFYPLRGHL